MRRGVKKHVRFGRIHADVVDFAGAISDIAARVARAEGGYVVTPNVDHVCLAESSPPLCEAYRRAALSLADGMPLLWLARAMGHPLPAKISGSDLIEPLVGRAAEGGWRVFFLGGAPGVAAHAAEVLVARHPHLKVVGHLAPPLGFERDPVANQAVLTAITEARAQLVFVALGCPKQELWMAAHAHALAPALCLGVGASLDFIAGVVRRAPAWMSRVGLEWVFRLAQEPGRMAQRYLVRDRAILGIAWRMLRLPRPERAWETQ